MESTALHFAFPKTVWDYYHCEEPQWSITWLVYGKPDSSCPTSVDVYQVVAFYLFLLCIFCFFIQVFVGSRRKDYRKVEKPDGGKGDYEELFKNMDLNNNNRFQSYDYPMDHRERYRLHCSCLTCLNM